MPPNTIFLVGEPNLAHVAGEKTPVDADKRVILTHAPAATLSDEK